MRRSTSKSQARPEESSVSVIIALIEGFEPWMEASSCAGVDPELWYPEVGGDPRTAKRLCASCPVREACLAYALRTAQPFGVWGGLTARERRKLDYLGPTTQRVSHAELLGTRRDIRN
jgi:hypothetical protein